MMDAREAFVEMETRKINLVHTFDTFWHASVDVKGETITTKKRNVKSISVIALTPIGAIQSLCWKLDGESSLFEEAPPF